MAISGFVALIATFLTVNLIGMATAGVMAGQPIGSLPVAVFGLDPDVFVTATALDADARRLLLWPTMITAIVLVGIGAPSGAILYYYSVWIFQAINQRMRVALIDRLQAQALTFHTDQATGDAIYRVYQDSAMVTAIIQSVVLEPLMFLGRYLLAVAVVAVFDPNLAVILGVTLVPIAVLSYYFSRRLRARFRLARERNSDLTAWIQESVLGIRVIKATHNESTWHETFDVRSRRALGAAFDSRTSLALFGILVFAMVALAILGVLSISAVLANAEAPTFGQSLLAGFGFVVWNFGTFSTATDRANDGLGSIRSLLALWGRAQDMAIGLNRVFAILDLEPGVVDADDARALDGVTDRIAFERVSFGYRVDQRVLDDVQFDAPVGSVTAIVGPTGAGKSTLMSLLLRLADPTSGRVTIDGVDIRALTRRSLRRNVAIATQENLLFSMTVAENIRFASPDADDAAVETAARIACAHEFIEAMPDAYATALGERAAKLSTGQRQRIVIARAVVKDAPVLILDEPTAALDAVTEARVLSSLKDWGRNRCVFLITHRLATIRQADRIVYLRDGAVLGIGSHDALIAENDAYRSYVHSEVGGD